MGVDPGLTRCGFGIVEVASNRKASFVAVGVSGSRSNTPLAERLLVIAEDIEAWIATHRPDVLSLERVFSQVNRSTVMGVAQASGVVMAMAARRSLPVALHTPTEVKAAVTGDGRSDKKAVAMMVARILRLDAPPQPADAADALALALTHAWRSQGILAQPSEQFAQHTQQLGSNGKLSAKQVWLLAEKKARRNREPITRQWR